jgi:hypothetical protein
MNATPAPTSARPDSWIPEKVRIQLETFNSDLFVPFAGKDPTFDEMSKIVRAITVKAYELGCAAADPDGLITQYAPAPRFYAPEPFEQIRGVSLSATTARAVSASHKSNLGILQRKVGPWEPVPDTTV